MLCVEDIQTGGRVMLRDARFEVVGGNQDEQFCGGDAVQNCEAARAVRDAESSNVAGALPHDERCELLNRRLKKIAKARGLLDLHEAEALREAQQIQMWRRYGYSSLVEYMELELGYAPRTALDRLRVANALPALPQIAAALEQGDLSFTGARELVRVATPETEQVWLGATKDMNLREVEQAVSGHQRGDLPTDPPDPRLRTRVLRYEVREDVFALERQVKQILQKQRGNRLDESEFMEAMFRMILDGARPFADHQNEAEPPRPIGGDACRSSALSGAATDPRSPAANENTTTGNTANASAHDADPQPHRTTPAYQVAVTVCKSCKRGWQDGAGVVVEVSPAVVDRALCDAQDLGEIDGDHIQRTKQAIPPAVRRTVMRRDHAMCQVPGCRAISNVDVHHIIHREHGGTHSVDNLVVLCESHHLAAHDGTIVLHRVDGELKIVREGRNGLTRATRAVETTRVLRECGYGREVVRDAVEKARAHVGTSDLNLDQWIAIAERYRRAAADS